MLLAAVLALTLTANADSPALAVAQAAESGASALPAEIPLFPLPEVSLFPGVSRPFLIYEPRYREMIADALTGDRIIGMVRLRPGFEKDYEGRPPIDAVGCAGTIEKYELLPDGRYVILLRCLTTFRVLGESQRKPYRLARVAAIPQVLTEDERLPLSTLRNRIEQRLYTVLPTGVDPPDPSTDDDEFVNIVSEILVMSDATRQELLEMNSVLARARALADMLDRR